MRPITELSDNELMSITGTETPRLETGGIGEPSTGVIPAFGYEVAKGFTGGLAGLTGKFANMERYVADVLGMNTESTGGLGSIIGKLPKELAMEKLSKSLEETATEYGAKAEQAGAGGVTKFLGEAIGGAPAGIAEFVAGVPAAGLAGAAEARARGESELWGAVKGAGERYLLGKIFSGITLGGKALRKFQDELVGKYGSVKEFATKALPEELSKLSNLSKSVTKIPGLSELSIAKRVPAMGATFAGQQALDDILSGREIKSEDIAKGLGTGMLYGLLPGRQPIGGIGEVTPKIETKALPKNVIPPPPPPPPPWHEGVKVPKVVPKPEPVWVEPKPINKPWWEDNPSVSKVEAPILSDNLQRAIDELGQVVAINRPINRMRLNLLSTKGKEIDQAIKDVMDKNPDLSLKQAREVVTQSMDAFNNREAEIKKIETDRLSETERIKAEAKNIKDRELLESQVKRLRIAWGLEPKPVEPTTAEQLQGRVRLEPTDQINDITGNELKTMIKEGDIEATTHIKEAVDKHGAPAIQDLTRRLETEALAETPKADRPQVVENIKGIKPDINEALKAKEAIPTDAQGNIKWHSWVNQKGYLAGDFYKPELFGKGGAVEDNKLLKFIVRNPKEGKTGYGFDQLAQMAKAEGIIPDAKPETLLNAMRNKAFKPPTVVEEQIAKTLKTKTGQNTVEISPKPEDKGAKYLIQNTKTGQVEEYENKGLDDKGRLVIENGELHRLEFGDKIFVNKVLPKEEEFKLTPEEIKAQKVKPIEQQLPLGAEKTALEGKIPSVETPKTVLEQAMEKAKQIKIDEEMKAKQVELPEGKVSPPEPRGTLSIEDFHRKTIELGKQADELFKEYQIEKDPTWKASLKARISDIHESINEMAKIAKNPGLSPNEVNLELLSKTLGIPKENILLPDLAKEAKPTEPTPTVPSDIQAIISKIDTGKKLTGDEALKYADYKESLKVKTITPEIKEEIKPIILSGGREFDIKGSEPTIYFKPKGSPEGEFRLASPTLQKEILEVSKAKEPTELKPVKSIESLVKEGKSVTVEDLKNTTEFKQGSATLNHIAEILKDKGIEVVGKIPLTALERRPIKTILNDLNNSIGKKGGVGGEEPRIDIAKTHELLSELGQTIWEGGQTKFSDFHKAMKEHLGEMWDTVKGYIIKAYQAVKKFNEGLGQAGAIRIWKGEEPLSIFQKENISWKPKEIDLSKEGIKNVVSNFYTKFVMSEYPVVRLAEKSGKKEVIDTIENQIRRIRGQGGVAEEILTGKGIYKYGETSKETELIEGSKSLKNILSPLNTKEIYMDYETLRAAERYIALAKYRPDVKLKKGIAEQSQTELNRLDAKYGDKIDELRDISKEHREFERQAILKPLVDIGWLSKENYEKIINAPESEYYASFSREMDNVEQSFGGKEVLHRIKGSERVLLPSTESTIANVTKTVKLVETQKLNKDVIALRELTPDLAETIKKVEPNWIPVKQTLAAEVDPAMRKELDDIVKTLGGNVETLKAVGRNKLGRFISEFEGTEQERNRIELKFATSEKTYSHELGHFLDSRYSLVNALIEGSGKDIEIRRKELRQIADQRAAEDTSSYFKKYVRKRKEQVAEFIARYLTQPEQARELAPKSVEKLEEIIKANPKISSLLTIKPSGQATLNKMSDVVFAKSPIAPKGTITVAENGVKKYYTVPDDVRKALDYYSPKEMSTVQRIMNAPTRLLRAGATLSVEFIVRNPIRDQFSAMVYSKYGYVPFVDFTKGLFHLLKKDSLYHEFAASGAEHSYFFTMDRTSANLTTKDIVGYGGKGLKTYNPIEGLRIWSNYMEKATRLGLYAKAKAKGATPLEAMAEARESTLDFSRYGTEGRALNQIIAFWNANVQGMDIMRRRLFSGENAGKNLLKATMGITLPSILLWLNNHDNERYKEIPEWQKNLFWIIPVKDGPIIRIPKPFELGIIFGSLPERVLDYIYKNDPKELTSLITAVGNGASPGLIPTAVLPIIENMTNYSFFLDRQIENTSMQQLPPSMRSMPHTSEVAKETGKLADISPLKIDNMIRGWTGGVGQYALDIVGIGMKDEIPEVSKHWYEKMPGIKGLIAKEPLGSASESVNRFYDNYEEIIQAERGWKTLRESGREEEARTYLKEYRDDIIMAHYTRQVSKQLSILRKLTKRIQENPSMDSDIKRTRIDALQKRMTIIADNFNQKKKEHNIRDID